MVTTGITWPHETTSRLIYRQAFGFFLRVDFAADFAAAAFVADAAAARGARVRFGFSSTAAGTGARAARLRPSPMLFAKEDLAAA